MTLCDKYKPSCFADIKGKDLEILRLRRFKAKFPAKKAIVLHGPPGTGKTSLAHVLAKETKSELIEVNASDFRNRENINKIVRQASEQCSIFAQGKIILVDEIDGITKNDYGGLPEILSIIDTSCFPIIITANDIWDKKFNELRKKSELVEMKELDYITILSLIKNISIKEKINISEDILKNIAIKSKGDVRAAINDLQSITIETTHNSIDERDKKENIFHTLKKVFQNLPTEETIGLFDKTDLSIDEIALWLEENLPKEYKGEELFKAFDALSKADVFKGRIYRQQHWRFLVYQNFLLSYGISASKKTQKSGFIPYQRPTRILKIWMINQKYKHKKSISQKYAKFCHVGVKRAMKEFPIIKPFLKNPANSLALKLTEDEIGYLQRE